MGFTAILLITFVGMEIFSYLTHRFAFHGFLWGWHKSHHEKRKGLFEKNDLFPLIFASAAISLMIIGMQDPSRSHFLAIGLGVTAYGMVYFLIHDVYVHRRLRFVALRIPWLAWVKKSHALHHRLGREPYGLLFCHVPKDVRAGLEQRRMERVPEQGNMVEEI